LSKQDYKLLLGRRYNRAKKADNSRPGNDNAAKERGGQNDHREKTAEKLAKEHGVGEATVRRAGKFQEAAAKLGSDVPFSLMGGTAIGVGRGEVLLKVEDGPALHWVMTPNPAGLSTPQVYRQLDIMRINQGIDVSALEAPEVPEEILTAITSGDVEAIAKLMHNDLEIAAVAMLPELADTLRAGQKAGSVRSMVSGSGPTIAHLAKNAIHAEQIATRLKAAGYPSLVTYTSNSGTRLEN
jgi:4-diphosphocytidyl-2-C-methyl-D-erythritol kinase